MTRSARSERAAAPMTARGKRICTAAVVVALLGAGVGTWTLLDAPMEPASAESTGTRIGTATAPVTRGDLTDAQTFSGTLGYGAPVGVPSTVGGTLTWVPRPGQVVHRDEPLYAVDERPVRAMHGSVPLWRDIGRGARGADVAQLTANLAALGYAVTPDDRFGVATERAVRAWQRDRGLPVTGVVTAAQVAFVAGDVRVAAVIGSPGHPASGDVVQVTSTTRVVTATVPQRDAERLAVGTAVEVRVNGSGDALSGSVVDAQPTATADTGGPTVDVTVGFEAGDRVLPAAASARIVAAGRTERDVLSVPVSALVAGTGADDYTVETRRADGTTKRVRVVPGLVAAGRVAVTGALREGDEVVVPS